MFSFLQLPFQLPSISLPSIPLPTSIQRRFISFVLRRSLGNFVKPGQLDGDQVNAQLGSGFVEINDLELDGEAINQSLVGLPIKLNEGIIGSVAVTVPFQNILSAPLTIAVERLDLSFTLQKVASTATYPDRGPSADQLATSVVSVAQDFIHEELDAPSLRESIAHEKEGTKKLKIEQSEEDMSTHVPGALDPFVKEVLQPKMNEAIQKDEEALDDIEGVSMLTQVVEMVLARLSFKVSNITVRIRHEGSAELILEIKKVEYGAEAKSEVDAENDAASKGAAKRTIRIHGVEVSLLDINGDASTTVGSISRQISNALQLSDTLPHPTPRDVSAPEPSYEEEEPEEGEEEMDASMTQSMISLPPPNELPPDSPSSTMFFSATSVRAHTPPPIQELDAPDSPSPPFGNGQDINKEPAETEAPSTPKITASNSTLPAIPRSSTMRLISFGNDPIVLTLSIPARGAAPEPTAEAPVKPNTVQALKLNVKLGLFTILLQPVYINTLLLMADFAAPSQPTPSPAQLAPAPKSSPTFLSSLHISGHLKAIHVFLFRDDHPPSESTITDIFNHPTSAMIKAPCLRVQLESLSIRLTPGPKSALTARGSVKDLSVFFIYLSSPNQRSAEEDIGEKWLASPLLLVDHHMQSQYDSSLPLHELRDTTRVPIINWTDPSNHSSSSGRPKRSLWRSRAPINIDKPEEPEAIMLQMDVNESVVDIEIQPLHFFVDTRMIGWVLVLSQQIVPVPRSSTPRFDVEEEATERRPIKQDLRDYSKEASSRERRSQSRTPKMKGGDLPKDEGTRHFAEMFLADTDVETQKHGTQIQFNMIRCELRCDSSPILAQRSGYQGQRSGPFVLDLHELRVVMPSTQPDSRRSKKARFASELPDDELPLLVVVEWKNVLAFYAGPKDSKVAPTLSLGSSLDSHLEQYYPNAIKYRMGKISVRSGTSTEKANQGRRARIISSESPASTTTVEVEIPSLFTSLTKEALDGLQLWADDMVQWADRAFSGKGSTEGSMVAASQTTSRGQSVILGSRYFVERTASNVGEEEVKRSELTIRVGIDYANLQLMVKRGDGDTQPFEINAKEIQATVQVKPEGSEDTIISVSVLEAKIQDILPDKTLTLLDMTLPRRLLTRPPPVLYLRLDSISLPDTKAKQSKIQVTASRFTYTVHPDFSWVSDLARFAKAPPGAFEQVVPTERTIIHANIKDGSINVLPPNHPGGLVLNLEDISVNTELVNGSPDVSVGLLAKSLNVLLLDDVAAPPPENLKDRDVDRGFQHWVKCGYAPILHAGDLDLSVLHLAKVTPPRSTLTIKDAGISLHLCADTIPTLAALAGDLATLAPAPEALPDIPKVTAIQGKKGRRDMSKSIFMDENAFRQPPALGPEPDMVEDDLPSNPDFIDESYGSAAGARPLTPDDLEDYEEDDVDGRLTPTLKGNMMDKVISNMGGETIRMLTNEGIHIIEGYYDELAPESMNGSNNVENLVTSVRLRRSRIQVHLHSGYDWYRTRKTIEEEAKAIRRRLEKIRQLLAKGQTLETIDEKTSAVLYNSVYLGLDPDLESLEGQDLVAAIDANLADEEETASQESWESVPVTIIQQRGETKKRRRKIRTRSKNSEVEIELQGLNADVDKYGEGTTIASRVFATVQELKILDHMKTSTWDNFLTSMRIDSRGNKRETDSNMVRLELKMVRPEATLPNEEARLRAKILPIRLHVDQDALDFLKRFFSFQDLDGFKPPVPPTPGPETFFQQVEIFPVELKLDYKPKRVDYKALKEGKTIELMNFFHFEDAEMTLRRITLTGLTGWARLGDTLNDLWTPDVKANQLADVISGVAPIRSLVNVGTGVADLVLLPIAQYKKDRRLLRGVQKGTAAFMKTTAMETIKLGARLATGTQVILEHAEHVLGAGGGQEGQQFGKTITTEAMPSPILSSRHPLESRDDDLLDEPIDTEDDKAIYSRYSTQPEDMREGIQAAYKSLSKNLNAAAQTILAVPMEVYEQSGSGGPVRAVVRAVPIAVIKPMIGATEAVSKTLLGVRNTLDPQVIQENVDKYKSSS